MRESISVFLFTFFQKSNIIFSKELWIGLLVGSLITFYGKPSVILNESTINVASQMETNPQRILCWVVTAPQNHFRAEIVRNTWGRRCDKLLFMSSQNDSSLPAIGLPIGDENREKLWLKAQLTFRYIYEHHLEEYDWFFKADDDTYAIMENLRHYLSTLKLGENLFLGHKFQDPNNHITFLAGGSGYVLARETLRQLVEQGLNHDVCKTGLPGRIDDLIIAECMSRLGAVFADTRDQFGRHRFIPFDPEEIFNDTSRAQKVFGSYGVYPTGKGYGCCSNDALTFHYVSGHKMQLYEYLIYNINVHNRTLV